MQFLWIVARRSEEESLMDEFYKRVADYFDPWELVQLLDIPMSDIIDYLQVEIDDAHDDLEDIMKHGK